MSLESCQLCARRCKINRSAGEIGICRAGKEINISSATLHFGEEPFISGTRGSGTIFFTHCSLRCVYCQNYQISQRGLGEDYSIEELAEVMLDLQRKGAHNINLVTPTHFVPQIITALGIAKKRGLNIPVVYNTSGYETLETLESLAGLVDIYLPDIKYSNDETAAKYSSAPRYVETSRAAIFEMLRQVGDLVVEDGIARRGILVRHLVLPNNLAGSFESLEFLASLSREIWISLMAQYHPCYLAGKSPELSRRLTVWEYDRIVAYARKLGLNNLLTQELASSDLYLPDFEGTLPFRPRTFVLK